MRLPSANPPSAYLFLWAGDAEGKASDSSAGDGRATPASPGYGTIVASLPTAAPGSIRITRELMPANGHLLANGFSAVRTWLFDLASPARAAAS